MILGGSEFLNATPKLYNYVHLRAVHVIVCPVSPHGGYLHCYLIYTQFRRPIQNYLMIINQANGRPFGLTYAQHTFM